VGILSLLRRSGHTSTDSPDGLVGNNDLAPIVDLLADSIELASVDGIGLTRLTLIKLLTNASHDAEVLLERHLHLLCDFLVGLTKDMAPLAMTKDDPTEAEVLKHDSAGLTSVSTVAVERTVLG